MIDPQGQYVVIPEDVDQSETLVGLSYTEVTGWAGELPETIGVAEIASDGTLILSGFNEISLGDPIDPIPGWDHWLALMGSLRSAYDEAMDGLDAATDALEEARIEYVRVASEQGESAPAAAAAAATLGAAETAWANARALALAAGLDWVAASDPSQRPPSPRPPDLDIEYEEAMDAVTSAGGDWEPGGRADNGSGSAEFARDVADWRAAGGSSQVPVATNAVLVFVEPDGFASRTDALAPDARASSVVWFPTRWSFALRTPALDRDGAAPMGVWYASSTSLVMRSRVEDMVVASVALQFADPRPIPPLPSRGPELTGVGATGTLTGTLGSVFGAPGTAGLSVAEGAQVASGTVTISWAGYLTAASVSDSLAGLWNSTPVVGQLRPYIDFLDSSESRILTYWNPTSPAAAYVPYRGTVGIHAIINIAGTTTVRSKGTTSTEANSTLSLTGSGSIPPGGCSGSYTAPRPSTSGNICGYRTYNTYGSNLEGRATKYIAVFTRAMPDWGPVNP